MGRLVDSVMAALGLKPSDRVVITHGPINTSQLQPLSDSKEHSSTLEPVPSAAHQLQVTPSTSGGPASNQERLIPDQHNPVMAQPKEDSEEGLKKQDCMGCRLVGGAAAFGGCGYVAYATYKAKDRFSGIRRYAFMIQGSLFMTMLGTMGVARLFNLGIFDPEKEKMTMTDHLQQDIKDFKGLLRKVTQKETSVPALHVPEK